jgi:uncharacterized protein (DUF58 family)
MPDASAVLDADFMRKLERLTIVARKVFPGQLKGEKRSPRHGSSVEFADFRNYTPGDDFRYVDWNAYARLDRLFLKMFREEEDLHLYLLVDVSESMRFGEPETKLDTARRLAAAIGYIGLASLDRVAALAFADRITDRFRLTRGRRHAPRLFRFLSQAGEPQGEPTAPAPTDLAQALRQFAIQTRNPGVVVIISDFLDPHGYREAITALLGCHFDVNAIQVLSPDELSPELAGDLRLVDSETRETREITVSGALLSAYRRRADEYSAELKQFCVSRGAGYGRLLTDESIEEFVLTYLRRGGLLT